MEKPIEIRPLTLLFGKNGSGKSSFLKAMSFLGQNLKPEALNRTVYQISDETSLGNFESIVIKNDTHEKIEIEIEEKFRGSHYNLFATFSSNERNRNLENLRISNHLDKTEFVIKPNEKNENGIENFERSDYNRLDKEEFNKLVEKEVKDQYYFGFSLERDNELYPYSSSIGYGREFKHPEKDVRRFFENVDLLPVFDSYSKRFRSEYFKYLLKTNKSIADDLELLIQTYYEVIPVRLSFFLNWFKIESVRVKPQYIYKLDRYGNFSKKDYYGLISHLDELQTKDKFESVNEKRLKEIYDSSDKFLEEKLKDLGLGGKVEIWKDTMNCIGGINLIDRMGVKMPLAEASSGLIQILPILFMSSFIYRSDFKDDYTDSTENNPLEGYPLIMLEQPELHLHPSLQTKFAEFLAQSRSNSIIETHSEHIIRKIQVLIAQGRLKKEKVAVYYFDKNKETGITAIKEMELEDNGFFKEPWPDGFFDDSYNLTKDLLRANRN